MPIAIVGTGRSGTSMVARMLNLCGVALGDAADLTSSGVHNPKGYWEHAQIYDLNERLLAALGSSFDSPISLPRYWEYDASIENFYQEAVATIDRCFPHGREWAWKLPGATSTLAFWRRVIPDLKLIVCVRNPLDFAHSINSSAYVPHEQALALWQYYNVDILHSTPPETRTVTLYEDYFPDYRRGLEPLLNWLGLDCPAPGSELDCEIAEFHEPGLKHHSTSLRDLIVNPRVPYLAKELYLELLSDLSGGRDIPVLSYADAYLPSLHQVVAPSQGDATNEAQLRRQLDDSERERTHLEQILASRTHRLASTICNFLIRYSSGGTHRKSSNLTVQSQPVFDFQTNQAAAK